MDIRQRGMRYQRAIVVEIERGRDELPQFVPEKRECNVRQMERHQQNGEHQKEKQDGDPRARHPQL